MNIQQRDDFPPFEFLTSPNIQIPPVLIFNNPYELLMDEDIFKFYIFYIYFDSSITPEGHLSVDKYILGYEELYKFLNLLGTVFGWVASDVHAKLEVRKHS